METAFFLLLVYWSDVTRRPSPDVAEFWFFSGFLRGRDGARVKVRLARLQLEAQEQARQAGREFRLQIPNWELLARGSKTV